MRRDRVHVRTPGGGGYGEPFERDPNLVLEDVRLGRYSVEEARGVIRGCHCWATSSCRFNSDE